MNFSPLIFIASLLYKTWFAGLGYDTAAVLSAVSPVYSLGDYIAQALIGQHVYSTIRFGTHHPRPFLTRLLDDTPSPPRPARASPWSLIHYIDPLDTGARAEYSPCAVLSIDDVTPTRLWTMTAPVQASNAGPSTGVESGPMSPLPPTSWSWTTTPVDELEPVSDAVPTPSLTAALVPGPPDAGAFGGPSLMLSTSVAPARDGVAGTSVSDLAPTLPLSSAGFECAVCTPAPPVMVVSPSPGEPAGYEPRTSLGRWELCRSWLGVGWASQWSWVLGTVASIAVQIAVTVYLSRLYFLRRRQGPEPSPISELVQIRRLLEEFRDIRRILDEHNLEPAELRAYIGAASSARNTPVRGAARQVTEGPARRVAPPAQGLSPPVGFKTSTTAHRSVGSSPIARETRIEIRPSPKMPTRTRSDGRFDSTQKLLDRIRRISENVRRIDQAIDELTEVRGEYHRPGPVRPVQAEPPDPREAKKTARRAELNTSPLAYKSRLPGVGPLALDPPHHPSRLGPTAVPRSNVEGSKPTAFHPPATSTPASARPGHPSGNGDSTLYSQASTETSFGASRLRPPAHKPSESSTQALRRKWSAIREQERRLERRH
ncbi:hypothetical protein RhiJN_21034 [Ceratobasidium sp. AG-Ba]|nr:hypothetical protein RhiJN_21034 [Ceratobasidium sp. AG-Ba]